MFLIVTVFVIIIIKHHVSRNSELLHNMSARVHTCTRGRLYNTVCVPDRTGHCVQPQPAQVMKINERKGGGRLRSSYCLPVSG